jgi:hypothetical membrane protein
VTQPARPVPARTPSGSGGVPRRPVRTEGRGPARFPAGGLIGHAGALAVWCLVFLGVTGAARGAGRSAGWAADMTRVRPGGLVPGWAVVSAGLSPVVVTAGWLIAGAVQPASYSPVRMTVSVLAGHAGTDRWIMTGALVLVGVCQLVTAAGLAAAGVPARAVLAVAGVASIGIAACPEPARGPAPAQHLAWTALGAAAIAVWPAFVARRGRPRPLILTGYGCAVVTAVFLAVLGWLIIQTQGGSDVGLAERLTVSTETCWPFVVAVALRHTTGRGGAGGRREAGLPRAARAT